MLVMLFVQVLIQIMYDYFNIKMSSKEKNKTCGCACHSEFFNKNFKKELEHESRCCPKMNGFIPDTCKHEFVFSHKEQEGIGEQAIYQTVICNLSEMWFGKKTTLR